MLFSKLPEVAISTAQSPTETTVELQKLALSPRRNNESAQLSRTRSLLEADGMGDFVHELQNRVETAHSKIRMGNSMHLMHGLLDAAFKGLPFICRIFQYHIEWLSKKLNRDEAKFPLALVKTILNDKSELEKMLMLLKPTHNLIKTFCKELKIRSRHISRDTGSAEILFYFEDIEDQLDGHIDELEGYMKNCNSYREEYDNYRDALMNQTLYILTIVTTIFVPAQFLTGLYGMNFVNDDGTPSIPELRLKYGYEMFWGLVVSLTLGVCCLFWGNNYFKTHH